MSDETMPVATEAVRDALAAGLAQRGRRQRQEAAHRLAELAAQDPELVAGVAGALVDALEYPEAQTRWECLDALLEVAKVDPEATVGAFAGAEEALFDEGSAMARLSAFRYLARYGALSAERSLRAWPLMADAIQCYHGDPEYREMLVCLRDFAQGNIDGGVLRALADCMAFDAKNARGLVRATSLEICSLVEDLVS